MAGCALLAGCSTQTAGEAAVELIAGDLGELLDLGTLDATCTEPAASEAGETIEFDGIVESEDEIFVVATNVLIAADLDVIEADAIQVLAENFEVEPSTLSVECPDGSVIVDDSTVTCEITDSSDGGRCDLSVTLGDYVLEDGFDGWTYSLGDRLN